MRDRGRPFRKAIVAADGLLKRYATPGAMLDALNALAILGAWHNGSWNGRRRGNSAPAPDAETGGKPGASREREIPTLVELAAAHLRNTGCGRARKLAPLELGDLFDMRLARYSRRQTRSLAALASTRRLFVGTFGERAPVESLTRELVEKALERHVNPETWNSHFRRLRLTVNWAVREKLIERSPISGMRPRRVTYSEPKFFGPEKVERIMRAAEAHPGPAEGAIGMRLALGFFTGARTAEILRARWEDLDLDGGTLRIPRPKGWTCGQKPRIVQLEKNAIEWLRAWKNWAQAHGTAANAGPIVENAWCFREWKTHRLAEKGIAWNDEIGRNAMRHTYATMHVGAFRDAPATALNLGHVGGTRLLERHYRGLVAKSVAERHWRILPAPEGPAAPEPLPGRGRRTDLRKGGGRQNGKDRVGKPTRSSGSVRQDGRRSEIT